MISMDPPQGTESLMEAVTAPLDSGEQAQLQAQLGDPNCVVVGVPWPSDEAPSRVGSLLDEDAPMGHSALAVAVPANASSEHSIKKSRSATDSDF